MKKIAILGTVLVLLGCSATTVADDRLSLPVGQQQLAKNSQNEKSIISAIHYSKALDEKKSLELSAKVQQAKVYEGLARNKMAVGLRTEEIYEYVDVTKYSFGSSDVSGWDCSGLVVWFYRGLGIDLPHSASALFDYGVVVSTPKPGDIVLVKENGMSDFHHSGIYLGGNDVVHAGFTNGDKTSIIKLDSNYFAQSEYVFLRVIEN